MDIKKFSPGGPPKTRLYPGRRGYITNVSKRGFSVSALYHRKSNKLHITARAKSGYDDSALTSWDSTSLELELFRKLRSARVPFAVEPIEAHGFIKRGFVNFNSTNTVNPVKFGIKPARFIVPVRPIKDPGALPVPGAADNRGHGEQEPLSLQPTAGLQVDSDMACPTKTDPAQNPSTDQSEFGESIALDMSSPALVVPTAEHNVGQH
ncbi:hypothetical protein QBC33DRAFT_250269 [Phialemonium atrogriseum]|uniref:Uncharacterized protein n=1 Tax=Phialemonium atrogriseum TaxID=1093897 RepID=A0AAJ0BRX4_9PEZI|nr:uncharacterized protein QBC33DRAFT_250269 [Phialemonium atrogriseum]KAK1763135.1 hypothetical protein QBC33DRAFT_250269 [Phialemonium atrogriseum]